MICRYLHSRGRGCRLVRGTPVFGPGTKAMIAVAEDDSIRALAHQ